ncbi:MAG: hypothetical protein LCH52_01965 [Bacteroidetes bacterium]|nr:hypothetical protein [Bacteroidota bacterium]
MTKRGIIIFFVFILAVANVSAEKRYVSKTGSSTPPYTSWETAADSIMKAMRISNFGDTIVAGDGIFREVVRFNPGVVLLGSGWDNTWIQTPQDSTAGVIMENMCFLGNLKIVGWGMINSQNYAIFSYRNEGQARRIKIDNVKITFCGAAINIFAFDYSDIDTAWVSNSVIDSCRDGILVEVHNIEVNNNVISTYSHAIYLAILANANVYENILVAAPYNPLSDNFNITFYAFNRPSRIHNNLIVSLFKNVTEYSIGSDLGPDTISNNVYVGNFGKGIYTYSNSNYRDAFNNYISGAKYYGFDDQSPLRFNNFWNNGVNWRSTGGPPIDTISNITRFPMFVDETKDYHLQAYSPLIDSGDTLVKDPDGTRSDIGLYGGREGKTYTYLDLAPLEPRGFFPQVSGDTISLAWKKNHESDFRDYHLYGDTLPGFTPDSTKLISTTTDTSFTMVLPGFSGSYFIKAKSRDHQGNISESSEEIRIIPVGIKGEGHQVVMDYELFNNYPNPFNPSTVIGCRLKSPGRVILTVYTITGELVRVLHDGVLQEGYHETVFNGDELPSGIYLYKIDIRSSEGVPVYTGVKKMMLVK